MNIKPLGARVLVELAVEKEAVVGGIYIPESVREKPQEASVIAVGTGGIDEEGKKRPFNVKVGDVVLMPKHGGLEVKSDGNDYQIILESDILAVIS
jgi:chaperonin GroES